MTEYQSQKQQLVTNKNTTSYVRIMENHEEYIHSKLCLHFIIIVFVLIAGISVCYSLLIMFAPPRSMKDLKKFSRDLAPQPNKEDVFDKNRYIYKTDNEIGLALGIVCSIIYIIVCCRVSSSIQTANHKQINEDKNFWVLSVIGAFILQLIFGIIFGYWVQVITSFIFFALYAACFYSTIDYHQEKLAVCNENCKKYL